MLIQKKIMLGYFEMKTNAGQKAVNSITEAVIVVPGKRQICSQNKLEKKSPCR